MTAVDFRDHVFTAPRERRSSLVGLLQALVAFDQPLRVLDFGCGTGSQLIEVSQAFPNSVCVGVDISPASIALARETAAGRPGLEFHCRDYFDFDAEPFDIILADSVLQNIPGSSASLARKLANDLRPGGRLIASLPYDCRFNVALWAGRRVIRRFRSALFERLALAAAKRVHPDWPEALLRERIPYMYLLPDRIDGPALRACFGQVGLAVEREEPVPHASIAQPRHRLLVFRKAA